MSEKRIDTKTVSRGVAKSNIERIAGTSETRIEFEPTLHGGGVKGTLVKYKKKRGDKWESLNRTSFNSHPLAPGEKVSVELDTAATEKLFQAIGSRKDIVEQGIPSGKKQFVVAEKEKVIVIDDQNKKQVLDQILEQGLSDQYWELIADSQPDLADRLAAGRIQQVRSDTVRKLRERLTKKYPETAGPDSWQNWIYKNSWLFGANYQLPIEKQKISLKGVMPDYLFPTIDGFVDLLEIKLPSDDVIREDSSHPGAWKWTAEANAAIGQVVFYLSEIDRQQTEIEREINRSLKRQVSMLKSRAYILIGNSETWSSTKLEALRKLNHSLHGIEVLTYHDLIVRGQAYLNSSEVDDSVEEDSIPF